MSSHSRIFLEQLQKELPMLGYKQKKKRLLEIVDLKMGYIYKNDASNPAPEVNGNDGHGREVYFQDVLSEKRTKC